MTVLELVVPGDEFDHELCWRVVEVVVDCHLGQLWIKTPIHTPMTTDRKMTKG